MRWQEKKTHNVRSFPANPANPNTAIARNREGASEAIKEALDAQKGTQAILCRGSPLVI